MTRNQARQPGVLSGPSELVGPMGMHKIRLSDSDSIYQGTSFKHEQIEHTAPSAAIRPKPRASQRNEIDIQTGSTSDHDVVRAGIERWLCGEHTDMVTSREKLFDQGYEQRSPFHLISGDGASRIEKMRDIDRRYGSRDSDLHDAPDVHAAGCEARTRLSHPAVLGMGANKR